jgi:hypothetical protein
MSIDDGYDPPRGRSFGQWAAMSAVALVVAAAMVVAALGGLGVFSEPVPTPRPTLDAPAAPGSA